MARYSRGPYGHCPLGMDRKQKAHMTILGVGVPPILVDLNGDWDVYWGYRFSTYGHISGNPLVSWPVRWFTTGHLFYFIFKGNSELGWGAFLISGYP